MQGLATTGAVPGRVGGLATQDRGLGFFLIFLSLPFLSLPSLLHSFVSFSFLSCFSSSLLPSFPPCLPFLSFSLTALVIYNSHISTIHPPRVYNSIAFSILRVV